jgi:hypothetical protein
MGALQSAAEEQHMTTLDTFKHEMSNILEKEKTFISDEKALRYVKEQMDKLFPLMKQIGEPSKDPQAAKNYCIDRDLGNIKIMKMVPKEIDKLRTNLEGKYNIALITLMSSVGAKLNLLGKVSDVDIGVIVNNFNLKNGEHDAILLLRIEEVLNKLGYKYDHTFNHSDPSNRYFSFVKFVEVDGVEVEVEVKVRDLVTSKPIIELHDRLNNSFTREQIETYTYVKHILAETDKKAYGHFKKLLYESVFYGIDGAFVFPALTS